MNSCQNPANKKLLAEIRSKAKTKSKIDKSLSYVAWLNFYSRPFGVTTFKALKELLAAQEQKKHEQEEDMRRNSRLAQPKPWSRSNSLSPGFPSATMPILGNNGVDVPWPRLLLGSRLFTFGENSRKQLDEYIYTLDDEAIHYQGEELFISPDQTVLMALFLLSKETACGNAFEFSLQDFEKSLGHKLEELGMPFHYKEIERSLWRLTHCTLTVDSYNFKGQFLIYADTRKAPDYYQVKINPQLILLYLGKPNFMDMMQSH